MAGVDEIRDGINRSADLARKIAHVLGYSLDAFLNPSCSEFDQTDELMRIWSTIEHDQDRKKVLSFVRLIADQAAVQREA